MHNNRNLALVNVGLGLWLVVSALLWHVDATSAVNSCVTGAIVAVTALLAIRRPGLRFINTAAGVWMIASMFAFPNYSSPAVWNSFIVGVALALVSLVGPEQADMLSS